MTAGVPAARTIWPVLTPAKRQRVDSGRGFSERLDPLQEGNGGPSSATNGIGTKQLATRGECKLVALNLRQDRRCDARPASQHFGLAV